MFRKGLSVTGQGLIGAALLVGTAGCDRALVESNVASFVMGFLTASQFTSTSTEYRCFRNGVEIDCGDIPQLSDQ